MHTLIVCEKANAAKRIVDILSHGKARRENLHGVNTYHFNIDSGSCSVIGLQGHILELDYPEEFRRWHKIRPKELIRIEPVKNFPTHVKRIGYALKDLAHKADRIIIATDFDREGELIGVESLEIVKGINPNITVKRAKFSALTEEEIRNAFDNLVEVDHALSESARSRQMVDLTWGAALTRFISIASNQSGKDFLSVGRVQSPTLAIIVDKEKEIMAFKPKPYWEIFAELKKDLKFTAYHSKDKFWDKAGALSSFEVARKAEKGKIETIKTDKKQERPPPPYNTTSFLRDATRQKFSAVRAMSIAEDLYTNGYISYPRTDNTVYPKSLNLRKVLDSLKKSEFKKEAVELLKVDKLAPTRGKVQTTDHPPIYPTGAATKKDLNRNQWKIYELVVRRFLATLAKPSTVEHSNVVIDINGEKFKAKGLKFLDLGWRKYFPYYTPKEIPLPELKEGEEVDVLKVEMQEKKTEPPKRLGQGSLIQEMEKLGLGTKSTRHEIIQKLYDRGYVKDSPPEPTHSGFAVIDALERHAETITRAKMTSTLEKDINLVAEGKRKLDDVVNESQEMLEKVFVILEENEDKIGKSIKEALRKQNIAGICAKCGGNLLVMRSRRGKRFVGCANFPKCRNSFALPQRGRIEFSEKTCELCGAPMLKRYGKGRRERLSCINMKCESHQKGKSE